ncbi:hypothetical protein LINGRAHAP2_LOCUS16639 [Linum grandiflorum]
MQLRGCSPSLHTSGLSWLPRLCS